MCVKIRRPKSISSQLGRREHLAACIQSLLIGHRRHRKALQVALTILLSPVPVCVATNALPVVQAVDRHRHPGTCTTEQVRSEGSNPLHPKDAAGQRHLQRTSTPAVPAHMYLAQAPLTGGLAPLLKDLRPPLAIAKLSIASTNI